MENPPFLTTNNFSFLRDNDQRDLENHIRNYISVGQFELARLLLNQLYVDFDESSSARALEILLEIAQNGPPTDWTPSQSVPSSAHFRWLCACEYNEKVKEDTDKFKHLGNEFMRNIEFQVLISSANLGLVPSEDSREVNQTNLSNECIKEATRIYTVCQNQGVGVSSDNKFSEDSLRHLIEYGTCHTFFIYHVFTLILHTNGKLTPSQVEVLKYTMDIFIDIADRNRQRLSFTALTCLGYLLASHHPSFSVQSISQLLGKIAKDMIESTDSKLVRSAVYESVIASESSMLLDLLKSTEERVMLETYSSDSTRGHSIFTHHLAQSLLQGDATETTKVVKESMQQQIEWIDSWSGGDSQNTIIDPLPNPGLWSAYLPVLWAAKRHFLEHLISRSLDLIQQWKFDELKRLLEPVRMLKSIVLLLAWSGSTGNFYLKCRLLDTLWLSDKKACTVEKISSSCLSLLHGCRIAWWISNKVASDSRLSVADAIFERMKKESTLSILRSYFWDFDEKDEDTIMQYVSQWPSEGHGKTKEELDTILSFLVLKSCISVLVDRKPLNSDRIQSHITSITDNGTKIMLIENLLSLLFVRHGGSDHLEISFEGDGYLADLEFIQFVLLVCGRAISDLKAVDSEKLALLKEKIREGEWRLKVVESMKGSDQDVVLKMLVAPQKLLNMCLFSKDFALAKSIVSFYRKNEGRPAWGGTPSEIDENEVDRTELLLKIERLMASGSNDDELAIELLGSEVTGFNNACLLVDSAVSVVKSPNLAKRFLEKASSMLSSLNENTVKAVGSNTVSNLKSVVERLSELLESTASSDSLGDLITANGWSGVEKPEKFLVLHNKHSSEGETPLQSFIRNSSTRLNAVLDLLSHEGPAASSFLKDTLLRLSSSNSVPFDYLGRFLEHVQAVGDSIDSSSGGCFDYFSALSKSPQSLLSSLVFEAHNYVVAEKLAEKIGLNLVHVLVSSLESFAVTKTVYPITLDFLDYLEKFSPAMSVLVAIHHAPVTAALHSSVLKCAKPLSDLPSVHNLIDFALSKSKAFPFLHRWTVLHAITVYDYIRYFLGGKRTGNIDHEGLVHFEEVLDNAPRLIKYDPSIITNEISISKAKEVLADLTQCNNEQFYTRATNLLQEEGEIWPAIDLADEHLKGGASDALLLAAAKIAVDLVESGHITHVVTDSWRSVLRLRDKIAASHLALQLYAHWNVDSCVSVLESCLSGLNNDNNPKDYLRIDIEKLTNSMRLYRNIMRTHKESWPTWRDIAESLKSNPEVVIRHLTGIKQYDLARTVAREYDLMSMNMYIDEGYLFDTLSCHGVALPILLDLAKDNASNAAILCNRIYDRLPLTVPFLPERLMLSDFLLRHAKEGLSSEDILKYWYRRISLVLVLRLPDSEQTNLVNLAIHGKAMEIFESLILSNSFDLIKALLDIVWLGSESEESLVDPGGHRLTSACDALLIRYAGIALKIGSILSPVSLYGQLAVHCIESADAMVLHGCSVHDNEIRGRFLDGCPDQLDLSRCREIIDLVRSHVAAGRALLVFCESLAAERLSESGRGYVLQQASSRNLLISVIRQLLLQAKSHFGRAENQELGLDMQKEALISQGFSSSDVDFIFSEYKYISPGSRPILDDVEGIAACDTMLARIDLLHSLDESGISVPFSSLLSPQKIRGVREALLREDRFDLALKVSTKCGLASEPVWAQWGLAALKANRLEEARKYFHYCLGPFCDKIDTSLIPMEERKEEVASTVRRSHQAGGWNKSNAQSLIDDIIGFLEHESSVELSTIRAAQTYMKKSLVERRGRGEGSEDYDAGLSVEGYLRALDVPTHRPHVSLKEEPVQSVPPKIQDAMAEAMSGSVTHSVDPFSTLPTSCPWTRCLHGVRLSECFYYLCTYAEGRKLAAFCARHGILSHLARMIVYNEKFLTVQEFVDDVFAVVWKRESPAVSELLMAIRGVDQNLSLFGSYLVGACRFLTNEKDFLVLRQIQLFMGDRARVGLTCIRLFLSTTNREERASWMRESLDHLTFAMTNTQRPAVYQTEKGVFRDGTPVPPQPSGTEISRHLGLVQLQIEISNFFDNMPTKLFGEKRDYSVNSQSLFSSPKSRISLAEELLVCGNFDLAFRVIQVLRLPAIGIYAAAAVRLARDNQSSMVNELLRTITGTVEYSDWDDIVSAAVGSCTNSAKGRSMAESLMSRLVNEHAKVMAGIQIRKYKAAYLAAVRARSMQDVRLVLAHAKGANDKSVVRLCERYIEQVESESEVFINDD